MFRIILGIFVLYYLYNTHDILFPIIGIILFYWLDCLDGHLARSTNQVTVFGDYLDHFADISFYIGILYYIYIKNYKYKSHIIIYGMYSFRIATKNV